MNVNYYDRNGDIIDMDTFAKLFEDYEYKSVLSTEVGKFWVSTVWLGIDHSFGRGYHPVIFETMVFDRGSTDQAENEICERYTSEAEARAGHLRIVAELQFDMARAQYVIDEEPTLI